MCALAGLTAVGCGDDDGPSDVGVDMAEAGLIDDRVPDGDMQGPPDDGVDMRMPDDGVDMADGGPMMPPPPPELGPQVDRMGRAAISTGTIASLTDRDAPAAMRNDVKDEYNANDDPSTWVGSYQDGIHTVLAALDGVDNVCGNQVGFDFDAGGTTDYDFLALALADDRLFVNSASGTCGLYLAVEAGVLGVEAAEADCGGRTPLHDVMDITYTYLVAGPGSVLAGDPPAIGDGLTRDNVNHSNTVFPFFADDAPPPAPALGTQVDRMGRAAISTGTIASLTDRDAPAAMRNDIKDEYNANADPSTWVSSYQEPIHGVLAALDGVDNVCGNQVGFGFDAGGTTDYDFLALALADDRLFVNSASGTCGLYLAVEAGVLGVEAAEADCGGRTPLHDVMDITYTYLVAGPGSVLAGDPPAIGDGLTEDNFTHSNEDFPFFADDGASIADD
ncbi:MAG: hypothetical protein AAF938_01770 [Myxococcota bacterium]